MRVLGAKGYQTRVAYDGPTALRVAETFSPDVAFLDIGLPVMDGYELACRLRGMPGLTSIRLIAVTGYGQESDRQKSRQAGFDHHLVKPVDLTDVETVLDGGIVMSLAILHFVPYQIECPGCTKTGLVRVEHVIKGGTASRAFYCGACEHQWSIDELRVTVTPPRPPLPKPRTRSYGPKRSN